MPCEQRGGSLHPFEGRMVILADTLWLSIAKAEESICDFCIESRLGRKLTAEDFPDEEVVTYDHQRKKMGRDTPRKLNLRDIVCNNFFFMDRGIKFTQ